MKTYWSVVLSIVLLCSLAKAQTLPNSGPLTLKLLVSAQALDSVTGSKTNGTTVTTVSKSTVTNATLQSADFLALLENSFNTNFPSGAQLVATRLGEYVFLNVTDSSGTNVVQNLSTNCYLGFFPDAARLHSGTQTQISKSGNISASNDSETVTEMEVLSYDDSGLTTRDGTHTHFQVNCILTRKTSENMVTGQMKDSVKFQGFGYGTFRDQKVILQGSGSAPVSGALPPPPS